MGKNKDTLLGQLRNGQPMTASEQLRLTLQLAVPAILAQFSSVLMQYIDSAMVGRLGAEQAASIGLVSTSTWILNGFAMAVITGFSVQVAHACGSKDFKMARSVLVQGLMTVFLFSTLIALSGILISTPLPGWLGGGENLWKDASAYFLVFSLFIPVGAAGYAASAMLQASGNMKIPSILYIAMCALDVLFNYLFIYLCGMGVPGAALGTGLSEVITSVVAIWYVLTRSDELRLRGERIRLLPDTRRLKTALGITGPLWLQNIVMRGAYVMSTLIVAPLGAISIAANSFAITAESFCYMPGYGLEEAATTLVGQSLGAGRKDIARQFARITLWIGAGIMTLFAGVMFLGAPLLMGFMTTDSEVIGLGTQVLRIEAFAETFYAIAIIGFGVCAGAGQTLVPTIINLGSMWVIRIGIALFLTPRYGLVGYWIAMCIELNLRGIMFLLYIRHGKWQNKKIALEDA